jgi:hypothetical protein
MLLLIWRDREVADSLFRRGLARGVAGKRLIYILCSAKGRNAIEA